MEQIVITLFKLRYNLPDRVLESLVHVDHVTISRAITRMVIYMSYIKIIFNKLNKNLPILGDKVSVGLENKQVLTSSKVNEKRYKLDPSKAKINNKLLNKKRVKIEFNLVLYSFTNEKL